MVKLLKEMLYIEAKDKEFLLANITRVTQENGKNDEDSYKSFDVNDFDSNEQNGFSMT